MKGAPEIPTPAPGRGAQNSDPKIKNARCRLAMSIQQQIAYEITREKVGSELKLLVDQPHIARSEADAPDVDARVVLSRAAPLGEFIRGKINGTRGYDLLA